MKQSRDDLLVLLREQVGFLRSSGESFDAGNDSAAKQLAVPVRVLLHDTGRSKSLLRQLRLKDRLRFVDTSHPPPPPGGFQIDSGLAVIEMGDSGGRYTSPHDRRPRRESLGFNKWWSNTVLKDQHGNRFNRRDLVLGLAHQEGGAHVASELEKAYADLARSNSLGWSFASSMSPEERPAGSPVPANVRQIAWELQTTLEEQVGELIVE